MLKKTNMAVMQIDMTCEACESGLMRPTGLTLTSLPPLYPHRCTGCGRTETYQVTYPSIGYEAIKPVEPHNFCPRCGKRNSPDLIHTCTPPEGM